MSSLYKKINLFLEKSNEFITVLQKDGKVIYLSPSVKNILGFDENFFNDKNPFDFVHPDDLDFVMQEFNDAVRGKNLSIPARYRLRDKYNNYHLVESVVTNCLDDKEINGLIITSKDLTALSNINQESEIDFKKLVAKIPIPLFVINKNNGTIEYTNKEFKKLFGFDFRNINNVNDWFNLTFPDDEKREKIQSLWMDIIKKVENGESEEERLTTTVTCYDGSIREVEINFSVYKKQIIVTFTDVSQKNNLLKALKNSEKLFRASFESARGGMCLISLDGKFLLVNDAFSDMVGFTVQELINMTYNQIVHPDDLHIIENFEKQVFQEGASRLVCDKRYIHKLGKIVWVNLSVTVHRDENKKPLYYLFQVQDFTKTKESEVSLERSEKLLRMIINNAPFGAIVVEVVPESQLKIAGINNSLEKLFNYSLGEVSGKLFTEVFPGFSKEEIVQKIIRVAKYGEIYEDEISEYSADNFSFIFELHSLQLNNNQAVIFLRDITEKQKAEISLKESEERFRGLFEQSMDIIILTDEEGCIFDCNSGFEKYYGIKKQYVFGKKIWDIKFEALAPDSKDTDAYRELIDSFNKIKSIEDSNNINELYELKIKPFGKERFFILDYYFKVKTKDGFFVCNVGRDITELKLAERALRRSEERLKAILTNLPVIFFALDQNMNFLLLQGQALEQLGILNNDYIGRSFPELFNIDEENSVRIKSVFEGNTITLQNWIKDRYFETILSPQRISKGRIIGIIGISLDITEKWHANEQLLQLSSAIKQSPSLIIIADPAGRVEYANPKFEEVTGFISEEIVGKLIIELKGEDYAEETKQILDYVKSGEIFEGEFEGRKKSGEIYWEHLIVSPIKDDNGVLKHFLFIIEDITKRKELDLELKYAYDKAEEASRLKSSLIGNMNHELRTPMTGILGFAQVLKDKLTDSTDRYLIDLIIMSGKRLMKTLNDVIELSELESEVVLQEKEIIDVATVIQDVMNKYYVLANSKGLKFVFENRAKNIGVYGKVDYLTRILDVHIDNAFKYTHSGEVKIVLDSTRDEGGDLCIIDIIDTGIGIDPKDHKIIFEEFRQVSEGIGRTYEGTGLGLTISKKIMDILGGEIQVFSELEKGATFRLILPATKHYEKQITTDEIIKNFVDTELITPEEIIYNFEHMPEILMIEDNKINQELTQYFIGDRCRLDFAFDGYNALELMKKKRYDVVLLDINLGSKFDGTQVAIEIRKIPGYSDVPIVGVTGYASPKERERLASFGINYHLPKPFNKDQIVNLLELIFLKIKK